MAQLGAPLAQWQRLMLDQIRGAVEGGVSVVQVRESGLQAREHLAFVRECLAVTRGSGCRILVNDRIDVGLVAGADGVHLRENSISLAAARRLVHSEFLLGRSVHDVSTAVESGTADYLVAGSVFETASKPGRHATLGLDGLRAVVEAAGECPVWAIGGITPERMQAITACGVRGVAAIGAFLPPAETGNIAAEVRKLTEALRFSLDQRC